MNPVPRSLALLCDVLLISAAAVISAGHPAMAADRPNIILCMADDQGWGDVAYNGHPHLKTPVLDEMAATALRFDRFYAAAPVCSPTRGSVLTGRHPNRFGCFSWGYTLRPQEITVAEALKAAGYTTGHFGKWHLGPVTADSPVAPGQSGFDEWFSSPNFYENNPLLSHRGQVVETQGESSMVTVEKALPFIRNAAEQQQPFLAVIWFGNPHTPHEATPELRALYKDLPPKLQNYCGEITGIDRAMGRLRSELRDLAIAENTLLWYTSDNGARKPGSTGGLKGQKGSLWEGGLRVPAIIEWPARIRSPRQTSQPYGTVDIYPTLLELAGAPLPKHQPVLDGESLLPFIAGEETARAKPLGFWIYPAAGHSTASGKILSAMVQVQSGGGSLPEGALPVEQTGRLDRQYDVTDRPGHAAWIDGDDKLHRIPAKNGEIQYALFNLADDPQEQHDLAQSRPERVKELATALEDWRTSVLGSLNGHDYNQP